MKMELTATNLDQIMYVTDINLHGMLRRTDKDIQMRVDRKNKTDMVFLWRLTTVNRLLAQPKTIYLNTDLLSYWRVKHKFHLDAQFRRKTRKNDNTSVLAVHETARYMESKMGFTDEFFDRIYDLYCPH